jgi:BirA family transcriptional regulator, biotin operon repressor / biotin---[acetyl-CoA-carboxylase] ligase
MPLPHWLHQLETCPSTNRWAMEHLHFLNHGDAAFTRRQTDGRGQYGRSWQSPQGVMTATFVLQKFPIARIHLLSLVAGLAVIDTLETLMPELHGVPKLKWTNDILIRGRKLSGILCETRSMGASTIPLKSSAFNPPTNALTNPPANLPKVPSQIPGLTASGLSTAGLSTDCLTTAIVGVGLNRSVDFAAAKIDPAQIGNPISLHQVVKKVPTEFQLLSVLRDRLMQSATMKAMMQLECDLNSVDWLDQVRSRDALLGKKVQFETPEGVIAGVSQGINDRGELLIQDDEGILKAFNSGRILNFK